MKLIRFQYHTGPIKRRIAENYGVAIDQVSIPHWSN
jgi:hypothetical protein